jgi:hypothetical protein
MHEGSGCWLPSRRLPFLGRWLIVSIVDVVRRSLAPDPLCEQGLAAVGGGCCGDPPRHYAPGVVPELHPRSTLRAVARRRGEGTVSLVMDTVDRRCCRVPPHEQFLVRLVRRLEPFWAGVVVVVNS